MGLSLRDQLLEAGLISKQQADKAGKQKQQQRREQGKKPAGPTEAERAAQAALALKIEQDKARSLAEQAKAEQKAREAQAKQLIEQNRLPKVDSDDLYNFPDGKKVRRVPVTPQLRTQLSKGEIAIVRLEGRYELVPASVVERIRERNARAVVLFNNPQSAAPAAVDENDPYKGFEVPDDLIW